jgi:cytochrome d ubiquinol oxidase subunit II
MSQAVSNYCDGSRLGKLQWLYTIRFFMTVEAAAAPQSSLTFMFWGCGIVIFPLMLLYTLVSYRAFKGKVVPTAEHH